MSNAVTAGSIGEQEARFDPADYLLGLVRSTVAKEQNTEIALPGFGAVVVLSTRGEYFTDIAPAKLPDFCSWPRSRYVERKLDDQDIDRCGKDGRLGRNIDEFIWHAALAAAQGRLIEGCRRDDVVLLKHWPNLTRLAVTPNAVRIAALLTRYPTTVSLAYRLLKIPAGELNDFYSAAYSAGWAIAVNRGPNAEETDVTELVAHRQRGLLSQILDRISRL